MISVFKTKAFVLSTIVSIISAVGLSSAQSSTPDSDFQVWNETTLVLPVVRSKDEKGKTVDKVSFLILGTLRLGQNRLFPVDRRIGVGLDFRLNNNFSFAPSYYYRSGEETRNRRDTEHRVRFDLTYSKKWSKVAIKDRSRIEYRIRNSRPDSVRYRNKFTFSVPVKKDGKELFTPFVADEIFYDFRDQEFSRNEISAGIAKKLSKAVSAEFYYLNRRNRSGTIRTINGVGANFKIQLR